VNPEPRTTSDPGNQPTASKRRELRDRVIQYRPGASSLGSEDYDITLATVMYGGGVRAGRPDTEVTPFRPSSIRGNLRFWWRATRGAQFSSWEDLHTRESEIWGSQDKPSRVKIRVEVTTRPESMALDQIPREDPRRYGLFPPYNEKGVDYTERRLLAPGAQFRLTLQMPKQEDLWDDVQASLWAWLNFGGLGARSRRGAGALYCKDFAGWTKQHLQGTGETRAWPTMKGGFLLAGKRRVSILTCWQELLQIYKDFRSGQDPRAGRWPEANEIRWIRQGAARREQQGFPRAQLGLPIIFHFKDRSRDPSDQTLSAVMGNDLARMAGPVILRPFVVSPTEAIPTILILNSEKPRALALYEGGEQRRFNEQRVELGAINAIARLLNYAGERLGVQANRL